MRMRRVRKMRMTVTMTMGVAESAVTVAGVER